MSENKLNHCEVVQQNITINGTEKDVNLKNIESDNTEESSANKNNIESEDNELDYDSCVSTKHNDIGTFNEIKSGEKTENSSKYSINEKYDTVLNKKSEEKDEGKCFKISYHNFNSSIIKNSFSYSINNKTSSEKSKESNYLNKNGKINQKKEKNAYLNDNQDNNTVLNTSSYSDYENDNQFENEKNVEDSNGFYNETKSHTNLLNSPFLQNNFDPCTTVSNAEYGDSNVFKTPEKVLNNENGIFNSNLKKHHFEDKNHNEVSKEFNGNKDIEDNEMREEISNFHGNNNEAENLAKYNNEIDNNDKDKTQKYTYDSSTDSHKKPHLKHIVESQLSNKTSDSSEHQSYSSYAAAAAQYMQHQQMMMSPSNYLPFMMTPAYQLMLQQNFLKDAHDEDLSSDSSANEVPLNLQTSKSSSNDKCAVDNNCIIDSKIDKYKQNINTHLLQQTFADFNKSNSKFKEFFSKAAQNKFNLEQMQSYYNFYQLNNSKNSVLTPKPDVPPPPKRPLTPYMRFSKCMWQEVKLNNPGLSVCEIGATIGSMWRELSSEQKQRHNDDFTLDKVRYDTELKQYLKETGLKSRDLVKLRTKNKLSGKNSHRKVANNFSYTTGSQQSSYNKPYEAHNSHLPQSFMPLHMSMFSSMLPQMWAHQYNSKQHQMLASLQLAQQQGFYFNNYNHHDKTSSHSNSHVKNSSIDQNDTTINDTTSISNSNTTNVSASVNTNTRTSSESTSIYL